MQSLLHLVFVSNNYIIGHGCGYWASEASPTLGCSIEILRDIYMYVGMSVCLSYVKLTA